MQMEYRLPCARAHIQNGSVAAFYLTLAGDFRRGEVTATYDVGVIRTRRVETGDMFFRNYQNVGWGLGINVLKGKRVLVLIDLFRRNLAANNFAK